MKKLLILFIMMFLVLSIKVNAYQKTGHSNFAELKFVNKNSGKLLIDLTSKDIENAYKSLGRARFWGWKYNYLLLNEQATYIGEVIFSKSNRTNTPFLISYQIQEREFAEESVSCVGNISIKANGNYKKIVDGGISGGYERESNSTTSTTYTETSKIDFEVRPFYKLTYRVAGDAEITTCVCKYYALGITFKKGAWEVVKVMTSYYELIEEPLNE